MTLRWPEGVIPYVISSKFCKYDFYSIQYVTYVNGNISKDFFSILFAVSIITRNPSACRFFAPSRFNSFYLCM